MLRFASTSRPTREAARRRPCVSLAVISAASVDTVVHMSVQSAPHESGGRTSMKEHNVIGTMQLLAACQKAAGLERRALQAMLRLLSASYLLGVRELLPSDRELREFLAPVYSREHVLRAPVHLGRSATLHLPPATGPVELHVDRLGAALADVDGLEPESQWDWETVTCRVVEAARDPYRAATGEAADA